MRVKMRQNGNTINFMPLLVEVFPSSLKFMTGFSSQRGKAPQILDSPFDRDLSRQSASLLCKSHVVDIWSEGIGPLSLLSPSFSICKLAIPVNKGDRFPLSLLLLRSSSCKSFKSLNVSGTGPLKLFLARLSLVSFFKQPKEGEISPGIPNPSKDNDSSWSSPAIRSEMVGSVLT